MKYTECTLNQEIKDTTLSDERAIVGSTNLSAIQCYICKVPANSFVTSIIRQKETEGGGARGQDAIFNCCADYIYAQLPSITRPYILAAKDKYTMVVCTDKMEAAV